MDYNIKNSELLITEKNHCDGASYTGSVTVSTYLGDRLTQTQTIHNEGMAGLFEFIASCLRGEYSTAKGLRPCKLVLLKQGASEPANSTPYSNTAYDSEKHHFWSSKYAISTPMLYDTAPPIEIDTGDNPSSSITYHFRIPYLSLVGGAEIKKLLLLPANPTNYEQEACAFLVLDTAIKVPTSGGNFTIIIDWTLTFNNGSAVN